MPGNIVVSVNLKLPISTQIADFGLGKKSPRRIDNREKREIAESHGGSDARATSATSESTK